MRAAVIELENLGCSPALSYHAHPDDEISGLVNSSDIVRIATYTDTQSEYVIKTLKAGTQVFIDKPLSSTLIDAKLVVETKNFVKDVVLSNGEVSIIDYQKDAFDNIDDHMKVGGLLVHQTSGDQLIELPNEPKHQELCEKEQAFLIEAIQNNNNLNRHMDDAVNSHAVCLAAYQSIRHGHPIELGNSQ